MPVHGFRPRVHAVLGGRGPELLDGPGPRPHPRFLEPRELLGHEALAGTSSVGRGAEEGPPSPTDGAVGRVTLVVRRAWC
jgi:hypothetical protein